MVVHTIKVSEEVTDFDKHYWIGMEASVTPEENAVEQTKELRKMLEQVYASNTKKVITKEPEKPSMTKEETASWNKLVKMLTRLGNKEDALRYLSESKEWRLSIEAKQIANSLKSKTVNDEPEYK